MIAECQECRDKSRIVAKGLCARCYQAQYRALNGVVSTGRSGARRKEPVERITPPTDEERRALLAECDRFMDAGEPWWLGLLTPKTRAALAAHRGQRR